MTDRASGMVLNVSLPACERLHPPGVLGAESPEPEGWDGVPSSSVDGGRTETIGDDKAATYDVVWSIVSTPAGGPALEADVTAAATACPVPADALCS